MRRLAKVAGWTAVAAALGVVAERVFVANPTYRGATSDHFDGRRFHNHQAGWQTGGSVLKWQLTKTQGPWREWVEEGPGPRPEEGGWGAGTGDVGESFNAFAADGWVECAHRSDLE